MYGGSGFGYGLHWMGYGDRREPGARLERAKLGRIVRYLRPYWRYSLGVLACIAAGSALGTVPPLLLRSLIDHAVPAGDGRAVDRLVAGMVALPIAAGLLGVLQQYLNTMVGQAIMSDLRYQLFQHLQRQSLRFYTDTPTGQIMSRVTNDVGGVQNVVTGTFSSIVANAVTVVFTLAVVFTLHWQLALVAVVTVPLVLIPTRQVGRFRREVARETQEKQAEATAYLQERLSIAGFVLGRVFGRQRDELGRFAGLTRDLMRLQIKSAMVGRWFFMFVGALAAVGPALVYWYGAHQAIRLETTLGTVIAFVAYLGNLYRPIGQLANIYVDLQGALAVFDRIFAYLDLVPDIQERPGAIALPPVRGRIEFDHVSFAYPPPPPAAPPQGQGTSGKGQGDLTPWPPLRLGEGGRRRAVDANGHLPTSAAPGRSPFPSWEGGQGVRSSTLYPLASRAGGEGPGVEPRLALDDVSFTIEPGQLVALVGPSGAGKTTTTYLVPRFYDPTAGRVLLDGHDLRDVTLDSLAAQIGVVTQESFLFHASIRENLLYARPKATEAELVAACRAANIHEFIAALPQGYDTVVGERGFRLSGGERQRVSIARAILKDPRILILDEATSSLDSTSEALIQEALEPLMRGRTSLVIAHRLSTILAADTIVVLDGGRLVEHGSHEALLERGGLYARLYAIQFRPRRTAATATAQALP